MTAAGYAVEDGEDDPAPDLDICDEADAAVDWYELTHDWSE